ncbi:MAG: hypothetical protein HGA36_00445 [Candidatus Moranbacteria bacterium]|nr:hypothetical protein [Candidatus Moranbacteria bacterium]
MSIVNDSSICYLVNQGKHAGRICNVIKYFFANTNLDSVAHVIFDDTDCNKTGTIMAKDLTAINPPGWPLTEKDYNQRQASIYGLKQWLEKEKGTGSNLLRTAKFAQPMALKIGDRLTTTEVVEKIRRGYNDSVLIQLTNSNWVELAPRLPIALYGNENSLLPLQLVEKDELITGCLVVKSPTSAKTNWTNIYLDRHDCCIEVPFCIPLALA